MLVGAVIYGQIHVNFRNVNIAYKSVAVNVESIVVRSSDFFISFLIERVGNDYVIVKTVIVPFSLVKKLFFLVGGYRLNCF